MEFTMQEEKNKLIIDEEKFHTEALNFMIGLRDTLSLSYGPLGSNTLINDNLRPVITKDGYTILKALKFYSPLEMMLHELVKKISYNLVKTVGDGSTSAIIAASYIYESLLNVRNSFDNKKDLQDFLNDYSEALIKHIKENLTYKINSSTRSNVIKTISNLSNNNDRDIGEKISEIFNRIPNLDFISDIRIELNPADTEEKISYSTQSGFKYNCQFANQSYMKSSSSCVINNPLIFSSYEFFNIHYEEAKKLYNRTKRPILVLAEVIDRETLSNAVVSYLKDNQEIYIVRVPDNTSERNHDMFIDLLIYVDSDPYSSDTFNESSLGGCERVEIYGNNAIFIRGAGYTGNTDIYHNRIKELKDKFDSIPVNYPAERGIYRKRFANLTAFSVKVLVGGVTDEEKKARFFLVEDSILACKSAMRDGYSFGSNASLFIASKPANVIKNLKKQEKLSNPVVIESLEYLFESFTNLYYTASKVIYEKQSWKNIIKNQDEAVFNILTGNMEDIDKTTVISPVETDIQILKASMSIVGMLLSINQFIS